LKLRWALFLLFLIPAVLHLFYAATHSTFANYYMTVDEYLADSAMSPGRSVRVGGPVAPGSIRYDAQAAAYWFRMKGEKGRELTVFYRGRVPNVFRDNARAIVEGKIDEGGVFRATTLMLHCPHSYAAAI
jgi:cytochrome c-type biogenesis protein CcmE